MQLASTLASRVDGRLDRDADARASGLIINMCGWIERRIRQRQWRIRQPSEQQQQQQQQQWRWLQIS